MINKSVIIASTIHLIVPLIGFLYFLRLRRIMKNEGRHDSPVFELFIIFATYGGLLLVVLTTLFWQWSGIASLGTFYLVLIAPIVMGFIAKSQKGKTHLSKYNKLTKNLSLSYFIVAPITLMILFLIAD